MTNDVAKPEVILLRDGEQIPLVVESTSDQHVKWKEPPGGYRAGDQIVINGQKVGSI